MTAGQQALHGVGSAAGSLTGTRGAVANTSNQTGTRSGAFTLLPDGTFTGTGQTTKNWWDPTTAGIGANWSAKATNSLTNVTVTGPAAGVWTPLSSQAQWGYTNTGATVEGFGTVSIAFSRDGGATTQGTMTVDVDVGYTP